MKISPALILYFVACILFMLAVIMNNSEIMLVSKPMIIPAIFYYYLQETKKKINWSYVVIMIMCFIGDMVVLIDLPNFLATIIVPFLIAYLLFLKGIIDDSVKIRLRFIKKSHLFVLLICVFFLIYLLINSMDILIGNKTDYMWVIMFYGIILLFIGAIASLNYIVKPSRYTTFMILTSLSFVISDVFYILKKDFSEIETLNFLNNFTQIISYYFLTKYYLLKENNL